MRRGWKILAILVFGFLMMCVGALGGALGVINFYRLFPGLAPAPTITASPVVASIPTPLASPTALPTLSIIATLRPIPTVLATAGGNVFTPTVSAVEAISPTVAAPSATPELTPSVIISPTTTEIPTAVAAADTPAPAPQAVETPLAAPATFTPRPPTRTPTPSATPTRKRLPAPELIAPSDNEQVSVCDGIGRCNIKFEWRSNVILAENEWFDLRLWRKDEPHRGVARIKSPSAIVDFFAYRPDRYFWTVVIVQVDVSGRTEDLSPEQPVFDPQTRQAIFWSVTK